MTAHPPASPAIPRQPNGAWLKLSAAMADQATQIAGRDDLLVTCAPGAGHGHPACFLPAHAHIEVDGSLLGVDPATADPSRPSDRTRYPVTWGALAHECAHAAHTRWNPPPGTTAAWAEAAIILEESRIEHAQVTRRPGDRRWLRASAAALILQDFTTVGAAPSSPAEAGHAAALLLARTDAGILENHETQDAERTVAQVLGTARLARLRQVWRDAHRTADHDARAMIKLGRRWCRILGIQPDTPSQPDPNGNGQSQGQGQAAPSPVARAVRAAAVKIAKAAAEDFTPPPPFDSGKLAERAAETTARETASQAARHVFDGNQTAYPTRDPRDDEKIAARTLARALRAATAGERATTTVTSAVPPGRLSMRQALAGHAQRAAGSIPTAEPFTRTRRRRVPAPPLRVGIACDVSGSMTNFTGPVASAAWIFARATASLPAATTATVTYGQAVRPVTHPGHAPARVPVFPANDGEHQIGQAIDALDGALSLCSPGAARLLVIVSDGIHAPADVAAAQRRIARLIASGCGVIWLAPETAAAWPATCAQAITLTNPAATVDTIARAATRALTT